MFVSQRLSLLCVYLDFIDLIFHNNNCQMWHSASVNRELVNAARHTETERRTDMAYGMLGRRHSRTRHRWLVGSVCQCFPWRAKLSNCMCASCSGSRLRLQQLTAKYWQYWQCRPVSRDSESPVERPSICTAYRTQSTHRQCSSTLSLPVPRQAALNGYWWHFSHRWAPYQRAGLFLFVRPIFLHSHLVSPFWDSDWVLSLPLAFSLFCIIPSVNNRDRSPVDLTLSSSLVHWTPSLLDYLSELFIQPPCNLHASCISTAGF